MCNIFQIFNDIFYYFLDPEIPPDPCIQSPCGPNSKCRTINGQPVCTCLPNYIGKPPECKPECRISDDCSLHMACINNKCADPCPNTCGLRAECSAKNHSPICTCPPGFTGDPFSECFEKGKKKRVYIIKLILLKELINFFYY